MVAELMDPVISEEVIAVAEVRRWPAHGPYSTGSTGTSSLPPLPLSLVFSPSPQVKALFTVSNAAESTVAGCVITEGTFARSGATLYRLLRGTTTVAEVSAVASLAHFKERVESVKKGSECGIALQGVSEYAVGDRIVAVKVVRTKQTLEVRYDYEATPTSTGKGAAGASASASASAKQAQAASAKVPTPGGSSAGQSPAAPHHSQPAQRHHSGGPRR